MVRPSDRGTIGWGLFRALSSGQVLGCQRQGEGLALIGHVAKPDGIDGANHPAFASEHPVSGLHQQAVWRCRGRVRADMARDRQFIEVRIENGCGDESAGRGTRNPGKAVDGERARAQPGGFYAGWVTSTLAGPFKGEAGSAGW